MALARMVSGACLLFCIQASSGVAEAFDCLMDPAEVIELGSPVTGLLDALMVGRGDEVAAGQIVARLNSTIEASTVDLLRVRAESSDVIEAQRRQMETIDKRFERISTLRERGVATEERFNLVEAERIASQSLLAQAELNQELAVKELARAEAALSLRAIASPISGTVSEINRRVGEYVGQDDFVVRIVKLDPLKVEAFVPISMFGAIQVGDLAEVLPAAPIEGVFEARVTVVDRVFDAASGTFVVQLTLPNPEGALPAGHRCTLRFPQG